MDLLLLCAGAGDKAWAGAEEARPLRTKGKRQAQKMGAFLGRRGLRPDVIYAEPEERSQATAEKALKAAGWIAQALRAAPELARGQLPDLPSSGRVLVVARPGQFRAWSEAQRLDLECAPGVLFRLTGEVGAFRLEERLDPAGLPDQFPFSSPDGTQLRERPAYYYQQSAVIPYQMERGEPKIMIVGSSSGRHWVVPKGIVEPGLSPAESARIEAREEAGVEGVIGDEPLGSFEYEKWGATCRVEVFPMEVTRVLEGEAWEESHRTRRWVSAEEARSLLHEPEYGRLILLLGQDGYQSS